MTNTLAYHDTDINMFILVFASKAGELIHDCFKGKLLTLPKILD
jgi:hypothetical protein